jgi:hypothetical protein
LNKKLNNQLKESIMRKILMGVMVFSSLTTFAMTPKEIKDYEDIIKTKTASQKVALLAGNTMSLVGVCTLSGVRTLVIAVADTVPFLSLYSKVLTTAAYNDEASKDERYSLFTSKPSRTVTKDYWVSTVGGGVVSGISDLLSSGVDYVEGLVSEGEIEADPSYQNKWRSVSLAYKSTRAVAENTYGKNSLCYSKHQKIGVIVASLEAQKNDGYREGYIDGYSFDSSRSSDKSVEQKQVSASRVGASGTVE